MLWDNGVAMRWTDILRSLWSAPDNDVIQRYTLYGGGLAVARLVNQCAEGGICFIDCMKDNQRNAFYEADPMPGGQGGRLRRCNSDGGGVPSSPYFRTIVLFVIMRCQTVILHHRDSLRP